MERHPVKRAAAQAGGGRPAGGSGTTRKELNSSQQVFTWKVMTSRGFLHHLPAGTHAYPFSNTPQQWQASFHLEGDHPPWVSPRFLLQSRHPLLLPNVPHELGRHERV